MSDLYQLIEEELDKHQPSCWADNKSRPGFRIWRDGCSGCRWVGHLPHDADAFRKHVARSVGDLLIDLAGHGQLLASIDRIARGVRP